MSKLIYIVIALAILVGGFFLLRQPVANDSQTNSVSDVKKEAVKPQASQPVATKMVAYDGSAFSPASIEVKVGDTVTFSNMAAVGMWVASAPHPAHTDYPEFDAKKAYNPGELFTFTFNKVGTWKYHNHLNPKAFGSVTVK